LVGLEVLLFGLIEIKLKCYLKARFNKWPVGTGNDRRS